MFFLLHLLLQTFTNAQNLNLEKTSLVQEIKLIQMNETFLNRVVWVVALIMENLFFQVPSLYMCAKRKTTKTIDVGWSMKESTQPHLTGILEDFH